jgi:hypothetical protein
MTEIACMAPGGLMEQRQFLFAFLGASETIELSKEYLYLFRGDGEVLSFAPIE